MDIWEEGRYVEAQHDSPINMPSCFLSFFLLKKGEEKRDLHEQYNNILVCK